MQTADLDVIKEIPGFKIIMKAVLRNQIQHLVEQLNSTTGEESILITASIADGTLSHLGTESGKYFLEDHDDIKSQFLGFCLKRHHRKKRSDKEKQFSSGGKLSSRFDDGTEATFTPAGGRSHPGTEILSDPDPIPVSHQRAHGTMGPKGAASNVRASPYATKRPRSEPIKSQNETEMSDPDSVKVEASEDSVQSDSASLSAKKKLKPSIMKSSQISTTGSTASPVPKDSESSTSNISNDQFEPKLGYPMKMEGQTIDFASAGAFSSGAATMNISGDSNIAGLDENMMIKFDTQASLPLEEQDKDEPNWALKGQTVKKRISGTRSSAASQGDMVLSQSGHGYSKTSDKDSNVTCRKCGKTYASPVNLKRHLQIHKEPLKCHCGASFGTKEALKEHENAKHKSLYVCKECPVWRQFWSRSGLFAHRLANHKTSSRLKCTICEKKFGQIGHLRDHMNVHSDEATCICDTCGKRFKYNYSLRKHLKTCDGEPVRRGRRPKTRSMGTDASIENDTDRDSTTCDICKKKFSSYIYLKQHRQKHVTEMRLCPTCGKSFKFKSSLCRHIKKCSHKEAKPGNDSEETNTVLCGSSKKVTVFSDQLEVAAVLNSLSQESTVITCPSEKSDLSDNVTIVGGPSENVTVVGDPSENVTIVGGPSENVTVLSEPSENVTVLSDPADNITVLNDSADNVTVLSGLPENVTILSGSSESRTVLSGALEVTTVLSSLSDGTIVLSGPSQDTTVLSVPSETVTVLSKDTNTNTNL